MMKLKATICKSQTENNILRNQSVFSTIELETAGPQSSADEGHVI